MKKQMVGLVISYIVAFIAMGIIEIKSIPLWAEYAVSIFWVIFTGATCGYIYIRTKDTCLTRLDVAKIYIMFFVPFVGGLVFAYFICEYEGWNFCAWGIMFILMSQMFLPSKSRDTYEDD